MVPPTQYARAAADLPALGRLIAALESRGYQVLGPVLRDGAILYDSVKNLEDLPADWIDEQEPARYRVTQANHGALFGYTVGPQSWKKFLYPPALRLFQIERHDGGVRVVENNGSPPRFAFLGVRACELAAIAAQDRALTAGPYADPVYQRRRAGLFVVAVNCTRAAATCFCASLHTGPRAAGGFDLALTELADNGEHLFVVDAASSEGREVLREIGASPASDELCRRADEAVARAAAQIRSVDTTGLHEVLAEAFDHPRWEQTAGRCLACGNCTMVCPTCFCTSVEDASDIGGTRAERWRRWDSCFTQAFSYIHGGSVRQSVKSRYRQWLSHKLAWWIDQFGGSGCVGCGRCITWCPAGIDLTEEVRALRERAPASASHSQENDDGDT